MTSKHSWRGRLGLAVASAGALLVPVFAPVAVAAPGSDPEEVLNSIEGLEKAPEPETPAAPKLKAKFTVTNPKADGAQWQLGETIRFNLDVTNDTGFDRSFEAIDSNLDNWQGCKWTNLPANDTRPCGTPTHTVTEEDVAKGSFTPSIQFQIYDNTGYKGNTTKMEPFSGEPTSVATQLVTVESFAFTGGTDKEKYAVGDKLTAALTVKNPTNAPITFTLADESLNCSGTIEAGKTHTCNSLTYQVTEDDLILGATVRSVVVKATQGEKTGTAEAYATTPTPTVWEAAKPFPAPNANPQLAPELSEMVMVEEHDPSTYNIRIPAIAVASNGDILAAYDLRPKNGRLGGGDSPNENSIVQRRSKDGGKTWSAPLVIAQGHVAGDGERYGWSDPSYVVDHETGEIFNFFVGSLDKGLHNGPSYLVENGVVSHTHRGTMNFTVANSKDDGHTWELRTITNDVLGERANDFTGCFATSGAGTQKMYEPHKGRLLQQATCGKKGGGFLAITIYSDDHGKTWKGGNFTADRLGLSRLSFDENKVAELSDGSLMLNSRIASGFYGAGNRLVAISKDGGENWGDYRIDWNLKDSTNNAQLLRPFPTADSGTLRSQVLLFSNTKLPNKRVDGHVSMSYDDGKTWPVSKQVRTGGTGYTTMAVQKDGKIGLLMEPSGVNDIGYVNFTLRYLADELPFEVALKPVDDISAVDGTAIEPVKLESTGNDPLLADSYTAEGLPTGLAINAETGEITGTPAAGNAERAEFPVTVTITEAEDGTGIPRTSSQSFTITLKPRPIVEVTPQAPTFDPATGKLTIPAVEGVTYAIDGKEATGKVDVAPGTTVTVTATPNARFAFPEGVTLSWDFETPDTPDAPTPDTPQYKNPTADQPVAQAPAPGEKLSNTGASTTAPIAAALTLVFAGLGAVAVARGAKRRS